MCEECNEGFEGKTMFVACCSSRCRMRRWRRTAKGRAYVVKSNERVKRPDILKACIHCKGEFLTARDVQELCSACSVEHGDYYAQKRYREKRKGTT